MHMFDDHDEAKPVGPVPAALAEADVNSAVLPAHEAASCRAEASSDGGDEDVTLVLHQSKRHMQMRLPR